MLRVPHPELDAVLASDPLDDWDDAIEHMMNSLVPSDMQMSPDRLAAEELMGSINIVAEIVESGVEAVYGPEPEFAPSI